MKIFENIFFKILLVFILFPTVSEAENRIDLDLRLVPKSEKQFYLLKENFNNKKIFLINGKEYKILRSQNEVFVDDNYDTKLHSLLRKKASLRYRSRFIESSVTKKLIQFKTQKGNDGTKGMNEFKIEINADEMLVSHQNFKQYLNKTNNQNSELYKQLKSYVDIYKLELIFSAIQYRDRFYLQDNEENTIFTISFDEVIYSKDLLKIPYLVVEFEINETMMANLNKKDSDAMVKSLNEFVGDLDKEKLLFNSTYDSKYAVGMKKLGIKPTSENIIEVILIFFALIAIIILFCIPIFFRVKSKLGI